MADAVLRMTVELKAPRSQINFDPVILKARCSVEAKYYAPKPVFHPLRSSQQGPSTAARIEDPAAVCLARVQLMRNLR